MIIIDELGSIGTFKVMIESLVDCFDLNDISANVPSHLNNMAGIIAILSITISELDEFH
jgi:hypothetical protein